MTSAAVVIDTKGQPWNNVLVCEQLLTGFFFQIV